jgi:MazG family protein
MFLASNRYAREGEHPAGSRIILDSCLGGNHDGDLATREWLHPGESEPTMKDEMDKCSSPPDRALRKFNKMASTWEIIERLRGESGCPWDRKQTPESVQTYLVEEAHEAAAAIRVGEASAAGEELGDLLFMVLFLVHLYEEQGALSLEAVCESINTKMIRRHPHVFGAHQVHSAEDVRDNWEKIKAGEATTKGKSSSLMDIPQTLPGLTRAHRILSRLVQQEAAWNDSASQSEQFSELGKQVTRALAQEVKAPAEVYGQLLISVTNLARIHGHRAEDCLHRTLNEMVGKQKPASVQSNDS